MTIYREIDENKRKSLLIMAIFVAVVAALAYIFGQVSGFGYSLLPAAFVFSMLSVLGGFYFSDKVILAISNAQKIEEKDNPELYHLVENVCIAAGLPQPKIYLIDDSAPNAFATGRDPKNAVVCFTTGLIEKLNRLELEGVVAHELSHVKNYDIRFMALVTVLAGVVTLLSDWFLRSLWFRGRKEDRENTGNLGAVLFMVALVLALLSPIFAVLIQLAVSRHREFLADASSALLTRYPRGLADALEKIAADREPLEAANRATAHLYIVNPLKGEEFKSLFSGLFNTHPPVAERVRVLRLM